MITYMQTFRYGFFIFKLIITYLIRKFTNYFCPVKVTVDELNDIFGIKHMYHIPIFGSYVINDKIRDRHLIAKGSECLLVRFNDATYLSITKYKKFINIMEKVAGEITHLYLGTSGVLDNIVALTKIIPKMKNLKSIIFETGNMTHEFVGRTWWNIFELEKLESAGYVFGKINEGAARLLISKESITEIFSPRDDTTAKEICDEMCEKCRKGKKITTFKVRYEFFKSPYIAEISKM